MTAQIDSSADLHVETGMLIDGRWQDSQGGTFQVINPATGAVLTEVASGTAEDIDRAVTAARRALVGEWGTMPAPMRAQLLHRAADLLEHDVELLARLEALDIGKPVAQPPDARCPQRRGDLPALRRVG